MCSNAKIEGIMGRKTKNRWSEGQALAALSNIFTRAKLDSVKKVGLCDYEKRKNPDFCPTFSKNANIFFLIFTKCFPMFREKHEYF